jgi:hypothetical protein
MHHFEDGLAVIAVCITREVAWDGWHNKALYFIARCNDGTNVASMTGVRVMICGGCCLRPGALTFRRAMRSPARLPVSRDCFHQLWPGKDNTVLIAPER